MSNFVSRGYPGKGRWRMSAVAAVVAVLALAGGACYLATNPPWRVPEPRYYTAELRDPCVPETGLTFALQDGDRPITYVRIVRKPAEAATKKERR